MLRLLPALLASGLSACGGPCRDRTPSAGPAVTETAALETAPPAAVAPMATAELTAPDESRVVGVVLTVLDAVPERPGGLAPQYSAEEHGGDVAGTTVSPRLFEPLSWELQHGSVDGYEPGPAAGAPEPAQTFPARTLDVPLELLVFGSDAAWTETVPLEPCIAEPCAEFASTEGSTVLAVPPGTGSRFGIGPGWTVALSP